MDEYSSHQQTRVLPAPPLLEPAGAGYGYGHGWPAEPEAKSTLWSEYVRTLVRSRRLILALAAAGALLGMLVNLAALPLYRARTSLDIQSLNGDFMDMKSVAPTGDAGGASNEAYVQTQIKMLQSDTLLANTVRSLEQQPHVAFVERDDLFSRLKASLHLGSSAPIPYNQLLADAAVRIKVKPLGLTRLVEITCDSWNADFSARFCNALTDTFREDDYATRGAEATKTSEWLTRQVADVRAQAEESERKLEAASGGDGLVLSTQSDSVAEDRLRQVQEEQFRAQADRMVKQAALEVSMSAPIDSLPSVIDNPNFRAYQQQLADLNSQVAKLVPPLTEDNPKVLHLRSQIRELRAEMEQQRGAIVARVKDEYVAAKHREDLLSVTYDAEEAHTSNALAATNKVDLLRREVVSEQNLYQTLLQRAKEAGFASAMQVNTIRIVDAAKAPKMAFSPRRGTAVGAGLLVGCFFGVGIAFYRERTSGTIRFPGEVQDRLRVQELGVIPSMRLGARRLGGESGALRRSLPGPGSLLSSGLPGAGELPPGFGDQGALHIWGERFSVAAEAYRNTTFSILLASRLAGSAKMYVISSPNAGEGKTTVASNLGVALSQSQRRVVILDGDMRKPGLHGVLGLKNTAGLRNLLRGELDPLTAPLDAFCQPTSVANLSVVTSGSGNEEVTELLHSPLAAVLLERLRKEFDLVLIDTPPMLHMADARIFADHTDGVILVFRAGVTSLDQAQAAHEIFVHDRVRVLGTILNDFNPAREGKRGYYSSYYRYKDAALEVEETASA